jgi:hypothetical protein
MGNMMEKVKDYINIWLNPKKEEYSLEEALNKYPLDPEATKALLETANGIAWEGYAEEVDSNSNMRRRISPKSIEDRRNEAQNSKSIEDKDGKNKVQSTDKNSKGIAR